MQKSILFSLLIGFSFIAQSQNIKIINASTKKAIENVYLYNDKTSTTSSTSGEADLSQFSKDAIIFFQHPSFQNLHLTYKKIVENKFLVELHPQLFKINEVTVAANKWEQIPMKCL